MTTPEPGPAGKPKKDIKRRPTAQKYDWETIRRDFIEGMPKAGTKDERWYPTQKELAEMHEVPYIRVRKYATAERWTSKREAAQMVAIQARQRKRAKQIAKNAMDFDEKSHSVAKLGIAMVTTRLAEIGKEVQVKTPFRKDALERLERGESVTPEELYSAVRYKELEGLAGAAERFQTIGMKALGTDVQKIDVNAEFGGTTNVNVVSVSTEMRRDDTDRMAKMLEAMGEAGLLPEELYDKMSQRQITNGIIDAEVVPNTPEDGMEFPQDMVDEDDEDDDGEDYGPE